MPDLMGDGGDQVLLPDQALGEEELGQRRGLGGLPVKQDLEGVTREDLALDEEFAQSARSCLHRQTYRPFVNRR